MIAITCWSYHYKTKWEVGTTRLLNKKCMMSPRKNDVVFVHTILKHVGSNKNAKGKLQNICKKFGH